MNRWEPGRGKGLRLNLTLEEYLQGVIARGERAPKMGVIKFHCGYAGLRQLSDLRTAGRIRIGVYGRNYRVIWLDGKSTAPPPFPNSGPYRVLDKAGDHWLKNEADESAGAAVASGETA